MSQKAKLLNASVLDVFVEEDNGELLEDNMIVDIITHDEGYGYWITHSTWKSGIWYVKYHEIELIPTEEQKILNIENDKTSSLSVQVAGDHYKKCPIQPVQYAHANKLDFLQGSVVKYVTRFRDKNGLDDLKKAKHFIEMLMELEYGENN